MYEIDSRIYEQSYRVDLLQGRDVDTEREDLVRFKVGKVMMRVL
jgi:hypothetical protein